MGQYSPTCVELCAGAGGMALGLERAGWHHTMLVERNMDAARTMVRNNPDWPVICMDLTDLDADRMPYSDMVCGGPPCQPFSSAGLRLGDADRRDMLMPALRLAISLRPAVIMFENVPGLMHRQHARYRTSLEREAGKAGYAARWIRIDCSMYGVPQRRRRVVFAAARIPPLHEWPPLPPAIPCPSLRDTLVASGMPPEMVPAQLLHRVSPTITGGGSDTGKGSLDNGTRSRTEWESLGLQPRSIDDLAPTILGGGDGHGTYNGGPQQRRRWAGLGVDARSAGPEPLAPTIMAGHQTCARSNTTMEVYRMMGLDPRDAESGEPYEGLVRLSIRNVAAIQGFPPSYEFCGSKRSQYQQIGNAFPAPAAGQLGRWARRLL